MRSLFDADLEQIAVKTEAVGSVIEDDEVPESAKGSRKRNNAVVNGGRLGTVLGGDFDAVRCPEREAAGGRPPRR